MGGNPLWAKFPDYGKTICRNESFVSALTAAILPMQSMTKGVIFSSLTET